MNDFDCESSRLDSWRLESTLRSHSRNFNFDKLRRDRLGSASVRRPPVQPVYPSRRVRIRESARHRDVKMAADGVSEGGGTGWPSTKIQLLLLFKVSGSPSINPADWIPGSART